MSNFPHASGLVIELFARDHWCFPLPRPTGRGALLNESRADRGVRNDALTSEQVAAAAAPRLQPSFVETQEIGIRCQSGPFADFTEHIDES